MWLKLKLKINRRYIYPLVKLVMSDQIKESIEAAEITQESMLDLADLGISKLPNCTISIPWQKKLHN